MIKEISDSAVICNIIEAQPSLAEPDIQLHLFQALPKSDKMDLIIQKAVELGVYRIYPVLTERCVSRPDRKSSERKRQRWQKIALEAAKQCGRGIIPQIAEIITFDECITRLAELDVSLMCYEKAAFRSGQLISAPAKAQDFLSEAKAALNKAKQRRRRSAE